MFPLLLLQIIQTPKGVWMRSHFAYCIPFQSDDVQCKTDSQNTTNRQTFYDKISWRCLCFFLPIFMLICIDNAMRLMISILSNSLTFCVCPFNNIIWCIKTILTRNFKCKQLDIDFTLCFNKVISPFHLFSKIIQSIWTKHCLASWYYMAVTPGEKAKPSFAISQFQWYH